MLVKLIHYVGTDEDLLALEGKELTVTEKEINDEGNIGLHEFTDITDGETYLFTHRELFLSTFEAKES